jgi:hypothetical protein
MTSDPESTTREALRRFEIGQTDFEEIIDARGVRSFMIRDEEDPRFFRIESENPSGGFSVSATGLRLPPSLDRPKELPRQLPFIADATTVVMIMPGTGSVVIRWENPRDPKGAFQGVRDSLIGEGWAEVAPDSEGLQTTAETGSPIRLEVRKDGTERTLTLFEGQHQSDLVLTEDRIA